MPQPFRGKSTPKHEAEENDNCTENNQKFPDLMHQPICFDKSRDGKSRMVGRDAVEPKNRIAKSTAPRSIPLPTLSGPPSRARVAQRDACEEIRVMAVKFRDYYETLGVPKTASDNEIRAAFRKLARKHHPDGAKEKKAGEEEITQINQANSVEVQPETRDK